MSAPKACVAVLLVEDENDIREALVEFLEIEGFQVYSAANGREAIETLRAMPQPALILADMMTIPDGPSLMGVLRADDQFASLPMVIISLPEATEGQRRAKKPIDLDDLVRLVDEFCVRRT